MSKIYAVKKGIVPGIYYSWPECEVNVKNFPGAVFKSFQNIEDAKKFLGINEPSQPKSIDVVESTKTYDLIAYVDGSYNNENKRYSYGAIIILPDKTLIKLADIGRDIAAASMRNVAGEILGAEQAMLFCLNNGYKSIQIYHDYEGIGKWCTGEWEARNGFTSSYRDRYKEFCKKIEISFVKVKGHSGDKYNDMVDELAKSMIFED